MAAEDSEPVAVGSQVEDSEAVGSQAEDLVEESDGRILQESDGRILSDGQILYNGTTFSIGIKGTAVPAPS